MIRSQQSNYRLAFCIVTGVVLLILSHQSQAEQLPKGGDYVNSIGMRLVRIEPGHFSMGCQNPTLFAKLKFGFESGHYEYLPDGDWDEHPVHKVTITQAFYMAEMEVTLEQYRKFRRGFAGSEEFGPYVSGISWDEAVEFCKWLSAKEKRSYRLPTEAEWEYACRAGTKSLFWSGEAVPEKGAANPWGLKNMHAAPGEWCLDWHGMYSDTEQIDPVGPAEGIARVIRGSGLDSIKEPYYLRSANRAAYVPYFPDAKSESSSDVKKLARLPVGFRVVIGQMPKTKAIAVHKPFVQQCINQDTLNAAIAPDPDEPYFRKLPLHPVPPENIPVANRRRAVTIAGLHPGLLDHNHSPGMDICSNGDVIAVYYTSDHQNEAKPEVGLILSRLRFGTDQWDMPDMLIDLLDTNDHAPLLWNDNGTIWLFWGGVKTGIPFKWCTSEDNGATFSKIHFPVIAESSKGSDPQPINSAFRDKSGTIYFGCDAGGSMLWASKDNGQTWFDTGGRTRARHTTFALLGDGSILGMGGKNGSVEGFNPKSISRDSGKSYEITGSGFPTLSSNQRPSLIRMASGRLLFATDFQNKWAGGDQVDATQRGPWLGVSDDDGQSWMLRRLPGAQPHEQSHVARRAKRAGTIGYSVLRQGPNGLIHLITSVTHPDLHYTFNEAWLDSPQMTNDLPPERFATSISQVKQRVIRYPSGKIQVVQRGGIGDNGRYLLHGSQIWFYEQGDVQWKVTYDKGRKIGVETYYLPDEVKLWSREHKNDGMSVWTQYWSDGKKKTESSWRNFKCEGVARRWDRNGRFVDELEFLNGMPAGSEPLWKATDVVYPQ